MRRSRRRRSNNTSQSVTAPPRRRVPRRPRQPPFLPEDHLLSRPVKARHTRKSSNPPNRNPTRAEPFIWRTLEPPKKKKRAVQRVASKTKNLLVLINKNRKSLPPKTRTGVLGKVAQVLKAKGGPDLTQQRVRVLKLFDPKCREALLRRAQRKQVILATGKGGKTKKPAKQYDKKPNPCL